MSYKVVYNNCYGGIGLSKEAIDWLKVNSSPKISEFLWSELNSMSSKDGRRYLDFCSYLGSLLFYKFGRHNKDLVRCVELLGDKANSDCSKLRIGEISSRAYRIKENDGLEEVIKIDDDSIYWIEDDEQEEQS